jgi:hypothetical protein
MAIAEILTPGHPAGCSCGECGCRQAHLKGAHEGDQCDHGTCLICTGCPECEERAAEEAHGKYIGQLVQVLAGEVGEALSFASRADGTLSELRSNHVYDVELTEGGAGGDMLDELRDAMRHLRNADRIVKWRVGLMARG